MPSEKVLQSKQVLVAELTEKLNGAAAGVLVSYQGINVADDTALRRQLREAGVEYAVVKNTLLGRAAENANLSELKDVLSGTTALAISNDDELAPAKVLCAFAEKNNAISVKAGFMEGKVVDADTVTALSKVPPRETLLAMLAGGLNATIAGLARAINAVAEKQAAPAEAAEAPAEA